MDIIFITGVSTGIGYAALKQLQDKYLIIGTVRKQEDAKELKKAFGDKVEILVLDVTDQATTKKQIESIFPLLERHGLHCLINNAGIAVPGPLEYLSESDFAHQMDVNVLAVRRVTNLLLPYLGTDSKYKAGKIINISSVSGLFNAPFNGSYCISKHALESMTDVYRRELYRFGIQVSAIEPGPIKTEIWRKNLGQLDKFLDTPYGDVLASADKMIANSDKHAMPVKVITDIIEKILHSPKPKTRYLVHKKPFMFRLLAHYLPDRFVDRMVNKTLAKKENYRPV
ncbi:MAG: SDR family NAD(P)-dependent oxidoreductase [Chitinophagales bacterium]|nr:SDR family NAD(P)-dependent oxidoreductase [Chitinophagales bacterium]